MINLLENVREKVLVEPGLGSNKKWLALLLGLEVFLNRQEGLQFQKKEGKTFPYFLRTREKLSEMRLPFFKNYSKTLQREWLSY